MGAGHLIAASLAVKLCSLAAYNLEDYLHAYIEAAGLTDGKAWLFQSMPGHRGVLYGRPMAQSNVYEMIGQYLDAAKVKTKAGCHSWRATGVTQYLKNAVAWR